MRKPDLWIQELTIQVMLGTSTFYCKTLIFGGYLILVILAVKAKSAKM